jgi:DnaJ-class molecular chaperone
MLYQHLYIVPSIELVNEYLVADILPGYKGMTKLIFSSDIIHVPNMEVQIILQEGKHPIYHRKNNDLYATCTISKSQARKGCTIEIPSLRSHETEIKVVRYRKGQGAHTTAEDQDSSYSSVLVHVPPNTQSGDVIHIVGKGWPIRSKGRPSPSPPQQQQQQQPQPQPNVRLYGDLFVTIQVDEKETVSNLGQKWYNRFHVRPSKVQT